MELSSANSILPSKNISCKFSNVPKRPSLKMIPGRTRVDAFKRLRAVMSDCESCGGELLEMEEWSSEMLKWGEKCRKSSTGVVELLECLEIEAIMGEDEGKDAVDYNRRAQIFDKSGKVFQALKHQTEDEEDVEKEDDAVD